MAFRCIKLNAAYEPVDIITWEEAFDLVYTRQEALVLWEYSEKYKIRSQYLQWNYPSIIVLKTFKGKRPEKKDVAPSLKSILIRDLYTCQYCGAKLTTKTGTRDHVIPQAKNGKTTYANLVACCKTCQAIKADKYLHHTNLRLKSTPKSPKLSERVANAILVASAFERRSWNTGFKKLNLEYNVSSEDSEMESVSS